MVPGVPAGLGPLLPPGRPQHAHAVHRVVGLRDRELPERSVWGQPVVVAVEVAGSVKLCLSLRHPQHGGAGSPVRRV